MKVGVIEMKVGIIEMKVGDTVHLKSGSPELTVENITGDFVKCIWFNDGMAESGTFHKDTLA